ncbi:MAG: C39 family peptidase [Candidatus Sericytochromatia bacterium]|nr:C39 family peptidase [Candidatus Sericytochromatia bacterium]
MPTLQLSPVLRQLPEQILSGLDRGWQALKNTFVFQFGETGRAPGATAKEAQANCGPASAAMILKQFGISAPTMHQMRRLVGAPIGSHSGPYALSTSQVAEAVKRSASQKGAQISYDIKRLSTNVDRTLDEMRRRLAAGEKLILLTSNIGTLSRGHYVVVKEVRSDGSIVVDDPGARNGENRVHTRQELAKALSIRTRRYGRENSLIAFQRQR